MSSRRQTLESWRSSSPVGIHTRAWLHPYPTVLANREHLYTEILVAEMCPKAPRFRESGLCHFGAQSFTEVTSHRLA